MQKIFFGKFGKEKPEQIEEKFYAAGPEGNTWYGGIEPRDLVFPIFNSQINALWKVKEYGEKPNNIHKEDNWAVLFDEVKVFKNPITVQKFIKYPYFEYDINLLNKISKATKGCGFFELTLSNDAPNNPINFLFESERKIFISLENTLLEPKEKDLNILINSDSRIDSINIFQNGLWEPYSPLQNLYDQKNQIKYSLKELLKYAKEEAPNKEKYLKSVLSELDDKGYFIVDNPIQFYDNLLVGRRVTPRNPLIEMEGSEELKDNMPDDLDDNFEELDEYKIYANLLEYNPNLILYGPPGTGKTYATKKIIECFESKRNNNYVKFETVEKEERVKFVTFHQSYSYEEFIEGIRPQLSSEDQNDLKYKIEDGILKEFVESASTQLLKADIHSDEIQLIRDSSKIWKVSLGQRNSENIYKECKGQKVIAVGWLDDQNLTDFSYDDIFLSLNKERSDDEPEPLQDSSSLDNLVNQMSIGDIVLIYDGRSTIRDIGIIKSDYKYNTKLTYPHTREVTWIKEFEKPVDIYELNGRKNLTLKTIYELSRITISDVLKLVHGENKDKLQVSSNEIKPYYLIIDEINRGNVSKIFGELITLIEKDKRDSVFVTLPYSKKPFTIPENLYIIGTMNTADRSISMLDTALRRRFVFKEVEPDPTIFIKPFLNISSKVNNSVELDKLLDVLNKKITYHLDRDHRIGHSYFMDIITLEDLYKAWNYKIIPLLMEYFYHDSKTIKEIIGTGFFNDYGGIKFLSMKSHRDQLSDFEQAIMAVYLE
ncbi:AAA family ATPase [Heyndrickxia sp. NPDC080065]|uniref:AAA family ATPase n=1 Tax=Heyndrickxia sp. NPDC080065 TaxID=3390568 RepID=UPI003D016077